MGERGDFSVSFQDRAKQVQNGRRLDAAQQETLVTAGRTREKLHLGALETELITARLRRNQK
jgi:hypothetical protein